ncbi:MAG: hypothetical protein ABJC05_09180, partial [Pyrinomonadaceae bacterium]
MKQQKMLLLLLVLMISLTTGTQQARGQTGQPRKTYQNMTHGERATFVSEQARRIAREMSGNEYEFT